MNTEQEENLLDALTEMNLLREENAQLRAEVERLNFLATHWERETRSWNSKAVELGCLAGVSDNEVPWFDKAKAAINELRQLRARVAELEADKARLEHVMSGAEVTTVRGGFPYVGGLWYKPTREEIDAAIDAACTKARHER